jgi:NAD(P)-dependent dehydrogenase (short-subunit alcohol dehydrogenase family)
VYLSSGLHRNGDPSLDDLAWQKRPWQGTQAYSDSKFHDVMLAFAIASRWPDVFSNALEPGWVATKMGGAHAPDDLDEGYRTQVWLALSSDAAAGYGTVFLSQKPARAESRGARYEQAGQTPRCLRGFLWRETSLANPDFEIPVRMRFEHH